MQLYSIITNIDDLEIKDEEINSKEIINLRVSEITFFVNEKDLYKAVRSKNLNIEPLYILSLLVEKEVFEKHLNRNLINREERSILFTKEMYQSLCKDAKENGKFRSCLSKVYQYKNELFDIPVFRINKLHEYGVEVNEQYFDYLYEYISPFYLNDSISSLSMLAVYDESNRKLFNNENDKVVVYKEKLEIYESFVDAILSNYNQMYEMNLLSLHNQGIYPQEKRIKKAPTFLLQLNYHQEPKKTKKYRS